VSRDRRFAIRDKAQKATPIRVFFGFDEIEELLRMKARGEPFLFLDHAYFQRGYEAANFRATISGIHQVEVKDCPHDRLKRFGVRLAPWRTGGARVIVIPAVPNPSRYHGGPDWNDAVPHRVLREQDVLVKWKKDGSLPDLLKHAKCLLAHVSVAAVEAACLGVPVVVDRNSPARPVSSPALDDLRYPDREQWAASLAYSQFSLSELSDGSAWSILNEYKPRGTEDGAADLPASQGGDDGRLRGAADQAGREVDLPPRAHA
jgi:hypothetical protein